jgi:tetratricopeptide (TPR) repeat protein
LNRTIPAELETVVLKALEKNPQDRYATVKEMADDLRRFLEDKPIRARRPSWRQVARKWARRHKPLVGAITAMLLVAVLLGGAAGLWWVRTRAAAEGEARALLHEARRLGQAEKWEEALNAVRHAQGLLTDFGTDLGLRHEAEALGKDLDMVARLARVRLEPTVLDRLDRFREIDRGYARAFADYGLDVAALDARTVADRIRGSATRIHLLEALDDWAYVRGALPGEDGESLRAVAQLADDNPWRQRLRDPRLRHDRKSLERLAQEEQAFDQPPAMLRWLGVLLRQAGAPEAEVRLLRAAQRRRPGEFYTNQELAAVLAQNPATEADAIGFYRAAIALLPQALEPHLALGNLMVKKVQQDEAIAEYQEAIRLKKDFAKAHYDLGNALRKKGQFDKAIAAFREAIRFKKDFPEAHCNLGFALFAKDQLDEAIAEGRQAIGTKQNFREAYNAHYLLGICLAKRTNWRRPSPSTARPFALIRTSPWRTVTSALC